MVVVCSECGNYYNDVAQWTFCPHRHIMPVEDAAQKDAALKLLGKPVRFVTTSHDGPYFRVQSVTYRGMVTLEGHDGEFAPAVLIPRE